MQRIFDTTEDRPSLPAHSSTCVAFVPFSSLPLHSTLLHHIMSSAAPVVAQSAFQRFLNHPAGNPKKKTHILTFHSPHGSYLGGNIFSLLSPHGNACIISLQASDYGQRVRTLDSSCLFSQEMTLQTPLLYRCA